MDWLTDSCLQQLDVDDYACIECFVGHWVPRWRDCVSQALTGRLQTDLQWHWLDCRWLKLYAYRLGTLDWTLIPVCGSMMLWKTHEGDSVTQHLGRACLELLKSQCACDLTMQKSLCFIDLKQLVPDVMLLQLSLLQRESTYSYALEPRTQRWSTEGTEQLDRLNACGILNVLAYRTLNGSECKGTWRWYVPDNC